jgi:hypothetical protein
MDPVDPIKINLPAPVPTTGGPDTKSETRSASFTLSRNPSPFHAMRQLLVPKHITDAQRQRRDEKVARLAGASAQETLNEHCSASAEALYVCLPSTVCPQLFALN